jgi:hypothetical protein
MAKESILPITDQPSESSESHSTLTNAPVPHQMMPGKATSYETPVAGRSIVTRSPGTSQFSSVSDSFTGSNAKCNLKSSPPPSFQLPDIPTSNDGGTVIDMGSVGPPASDKPALVPPFDVSQFSRNQPTDGLLAGDASSHVDGGIYANGATAQDGLLDDAASGDGGAAEHYLNFSTDMVR